MRESSTTTFSALAMAFAAIVELFREFRNQKNLYRKVIDNVVDFLLQCMDQQGQNSRCYARFRSTEDYNNLSFRLRI